MTTQTHPTIPVLSTPRLTLRALESSDEAAIFALRSDPAVNRYLDRQPSRSMEDARSFIETIQRNTQTGKTYYWAVTLRETGALIGTIALFDLSADKAETGYEMLPAFQGKGYMKEALAEVIGFAKDHLRLRGLEAATHKDNAGSVRLLEQFGFTPQPAVDDPLIAYRLELGR